jgi:hypothetical protein
MGGTAYSMNLIKFLSIFFPIIFIISCYKPIPRIYNEGTAYKMPRNLETSDFYKDIENYYQYEGIVQEYRVKNKHPQRLVRFCHFMPISDSYL